jgi:hypothetical protein
MDLELLSKPEQNLQSRLTAMQALPFHSESEVKARATSSECSPTPPATPLLLVSWSVCCICSRCG